MQYAKEALAFVQIKDFIIHFLPHSRVSPYLALSRCCGLYMYQPFILPCAGVVRAQTVPVAGVACTALGAEGRKVQFPVLFLASTATSK